MMPVSMVGRTGELAELDEAWAAVTAGGGQLPQTAVITGSAGMGKSQLVAAALDRLRPRPRTVLTGAARVHSPAPYDWLAAVLSGREPDDLPVPPDALAWLAQHPAPPRERYTPGALLRLAVRTVRTLVGGGPAVVVIEDLHALDPASLNLVGELATASDLPALLAVTSRPPEAAVSPHLAARALARLTGAPRAVRQHLGPLGRAEVAAVLTEAYGQTVAPAVVDAVHRRTGGNPYWLVELLAAGGGDAPAALTERPLPAHLSLADALPEPRAADLTDREVEVLACLAAGMSNKQVARSLGISVRTVTVHVSNLLRKTGTASRTGVAMWAVQHQLAGPIRAG